MLKDGSAALCLRALGWECVSPKPRPPKFVGLAWPHSSNLDGLLMVLMARHIGLEMSWMVKDALDQPGLGTLVRRFGAVFIDRSQAHGVVEQMVAEFAARDAFALIIPPEGTRARRDHWKSGFYHIALQAQVPVVPGFLDYGRKQGGFGPPIDLTGNAKTDMDAVRSFYETRSPSGLRPHDVGPIRLRDEPPHRERFRDSTER